MTKKEIRNAFVMLMHIFPDKDYHQRAWIEHKGPEIWDMEDLIGEAFSFRESILENHTKYLITDEQFQLIQKFYKQVDAFDKEVVADEGYQFEEARLIALPDWKEIQQTVQEIITAFGDPFRVSGFFLHALERIHNTEHQKAEWIKCGKVIDIYNNVSISLSYIDYLIWATEHFANSQEKYKYTGEQVEILNKLHEKLKAFPYDKSNLPEFIDSEEWKEIGELSKQALELFKDVPAW